MGKANSNSNNSNQPTAAPESYPEPYYPTPPLTVVDPTPPLTVVDPTKPTPETVAAVSTNRGVAMVTRVIEETDTHVTTCFNDGTIRTDYK